MKEIIWKYDEQGNATHRRCSKCKEFLTFDKFARALDKKCNITSLCKSCINDKGVAKGKTDVGRLKTILRGMKSRCYNKNHHAYNIYGGNGVYICEEWLIDTDLFINWALNNGYNESLTIDRLNLNKEYSPNNCHWATAREQVVNRTYTKLSMKKAKDIRSRVRSGEVGTVIDREYGLSLGYSAELERKGGRAYKAWRTDEWLSKNGYLKENGQLK